MKRPPKYIIPLVVVFVIVVVLQMGAPREPSWEPSFTRIDKIPYGAYILFDMLPGLFPGRKIVVADEAAYNVLPNRFDLDSSETYMVLNNKFAADELDTRTIMDYAARGHTVFIAAQDFSKAITDSLGFDTESNYAPLGDSTGINFVNPRLHSARDYYFKNHTVDSYFSRFDTARSVVLGVNSDHQPNFIGMDFGKGRIYLSSVPYAFTNYNILYANDSDYAFKALSYFHRGDVVWDEHYKSGRRDTDTPMRYVLSQPSLRWAYFTLIAGVLLFVTFMGRRRQRIIPEIQPLPNTTLVFTHTVAQLYYQHGDHKNIAEKKITYFLEFIRSAFGVNTNERTDELYRMIGARAGIDPEQVQTIFRYIDSIRAAGTVDADQLNAISTAIERFYAQSKRQYV